MALVTPAARATAVRRGVLATCVLCPACPGWWTPLDEAGEVTADSASDEPPASDGSSAPTSTSTSTSASTSNASSSTGADPGTPVIEPWCDELDPQRIYFTGTYIHSAIIRPPFARPGAPRSSCVGFDEVEPRTLRLRGDGRLLWMHTIEQHGIHVYTPDPLHWDPEDGWSYPDDPLANDELIPTTACKAGNPLQYFIRPGADTVVYNCGGADDDADWYDQDGELVYHSELHDPAAIATDGTILTRDLRIAVPDSGLLGVVPPVPAPFPTLYTARSRLDGFRAVVRPDDGESVQLWFIATDGVAQLEGEFVAGESMPPPDHYPGALLLAPDGALIHIDSFAHRIYRRELAPGELEVLYTWEDEAGENWPLDPEPFVHIVTTSKLFTGP